MTKLVFQMMRFVLSFLLLIAFQVADCQNLKLEHVRTFNGHSHGVRKVVFAPDGKHFASGGTRGEVFVWDLLGDAALKKLKGHYGSISDVRYCASGKYLISSGEDGQVKVWDSSTGACLQRIISPTRAESPINKVLFALLNSKADAVYFGGANGYLCRVPFKAEDEPEVIYSTNGESIQCAILSPDGKEIIFASGKYLMALDLASGNMVREYNTGSCVVNSLEFSGDGKRLLTWCDNSRVDMRDPSTFYLLTSFRSGTGGRKFSNLAFTEDQKYVVTGDHASRFNVWDLDKKQQVLDQGAEQGTIMTFDLENGYNYLLSGSLDKSIKLWRIVQDVPEEEKKPKKKKKNEPIEETVEPQVEIVKYEEPVEDVKQVVSGPAVASKELVTKVVEVEEKPAVAAPVADPIESVLPEKKNNRRIKPIRREHRLTMKSHQLTFEIWDAQIIDGDIVSIFIDDVCIVEEYSITAVKKKVEFDASAYKRVYLYLHAHNLGTISPNTVTMTISDGTQQLDVELRSDLTGSAAVELTFDTETSEDE